MSGLQDRRAWLGGGAALIVVIALLGWFFVISPRLSTAASRRDDTASVQQQNAVLSAQLVKLRKENGNLAELTASLQAAVDALPFDTGLPQLTRQVNAQAVDEGVALTSISVGAAKAAEATPGGAAPTAGAILAIPVTLVSKGTAAKQWAFLDAIQTGGARRALVTSVQMDAASRGSIDSGAGMTVLINVFTTPLSTAEQAQLEKLLRGDISN